MESGDLPTIAPLLVLGSWACLLLLVDLFIPRERKGITALLAAAGLLATLFLSLRLIGVERMALQGMIVQDSYATFLQILFLITGTIAIALAYDYLRRTGIERGEYYVLLLFTLTGMLLMAQAGDLIVVFLSVELLSIPLYILSGFARPKPESEESALKYFLLGAFASGFVVYGIALVFGATGTTQLSDVFAAAQVGESGALLLSGAALILVGLGFKVAAVPFHMWTPDVYDGAPSAVVAFMSVGAKAGGFAALLRVFVIAFPEIAEAWGPAAMWIAALTMTWGNVAAIAQTNIKRMLAYSSIAHAGYIFMALPAAAREGIAPDAVSAALFYLFAYMVSNLGAWGVVLAMERREGKGLAIEDYAGLGARRPGLALAMALFMLSLIGVPPTAGFVGKFYIFRVALDAGLVWLALVGVITSLISAYYYLRVVIVMYMQAGEPESRSEVWLNAAIGLTAIATFVLGILPAPLFEFAGRASLLAGLP